MTASATPHAKDLWCPIFRYRDCCFLVGIPLVVIFLIGVSTTPILMKAPIGFIRVILMILLPCSSLFFSLLLFGNEWFVKNGLLVRQLSRATKIFGRFSTTHLWISVGRQF